MDRKEILRRRFIRLIDRVLCGDDGATLVILEAGVSVSKLPREKVVHVGRSVWWVFWCLMVKGERS